MIDNAITLLLNPSAWLLLLTTATFVLGLVLRRRWPIWLSGTTLAVTIFLSVVPVGEWLLLPLENRFPSPERYPPADQVAGVAVVGDPIVQDLTLAYDHLILADNAETLAGLIELGHVFPQAQLFMLGVDGVPEIQAITRDFLAGQDLEPERVTFIGGRSALIDAVRALDSARTDGEWLLVASAREMPLLAGTFWQAGVDVRPWPVDFTTSGEIEILAPHLRPTYYLWQLDRAIGAWADLFRADRRGQTPEFVPGPEDAPPPTV